MTFSHNNKIQTVYDNKIIQYMIKFLGNSMDLLVLLPKEITYGLKSLKLTDIHRHSQTLTDTY